QAVKSHPCHIRGIQPPVRRAGFDGAAGFSTAGAVVGAGAAVATHWLAAALTACSPFARGGSPFFAGAVAVLRSLVRAGGAGANGAGSVVGVLISLPVDSATDVASGCAGIMGQPLTRMVRYKQREP